MLYIWKLHQVLSCHGMLRVLKRKVHRYNDVLTVNDQGVARDAAFDVDAGIWDANLVWKEADDGVDEEFESLVAILVRRLSQGVQSSYDDVDKSTHVSS